MKQLFTLILLTSLTIAPLSAESTNVTLTQQEGAQITRNDNQLFDQQEKARTTNYLREKVIAIEHDKHINPSKLRQGIVEGNAFKVERALLGTASDYYSSYYYSRYYDAGHEGAADVNENWQGNSAVEVALDLVVKEAKKYKNPGWYRATQITRDAGIIGAVVASLVLAGAHVHEYAATQTLIKGLWTSGLAATALSLPWISTTFATANRERKSFLYWEHLINRIEVAQKILTHGKLDLNQTNLDLSNSAVKEAIDWIRACDLSDASLQQLVKDTQAGNYDCLLTSTTAA